MAAQQGPNPLFPVIIIFFIMYFLVFRPEQKKKKQLKEMISKVKKNDQVVTTAGIHGTVVNVKDKTIVLRVDDTCKIEFDRESIAQVTSAKSENS